MRQHGHVALLELFARATVIAPKWRDGGRAGSVLRSGIWQPGGAGRVLTQKSEAGLLSPMVERRERWIRRRTRAIFERSILRTKKVTGL